MRRKISTFFIEQLSKRKSKNSSTMPSNIIEKYTIPPRHRHHFTTYEEFTQFLEDSLEAWDSGHGSGPQYVAAQKITPDVLD